MNWQTTWTLAARPVVTPSLSAYIDSFLKRRRDLAESSRAAYRSDLGKLAAFFGPGMPVDLLSVENLEQFFAWMESRSYAPATIGRHWSAVKELCQALVMEDKLCRNPMDRIAYPKLAGGHPVILSHDQARRLVAVCKPNYSGYRMRAIILTFLDTGLRVSELCSLTLPSVNLDLRVCHVVGKGSKARTVEFGETLSSELDEWLYVRAKNLAGSTDTLFPSQRGNPAHRTVIHRQMVSLAKEAGIDADITPHTLRHTYATWKARDRGDGRPMNPWLLKEQLGHENISTTQIYVQMAATIQPEEVGDSLRAIVKNSTENLERR